MFYEGVYKSAYYWFDKSGKHITLITETGEFNSIGGQYEQYRDASLFAYDFLLSGDSVIACWKMKDSVIDCPVDIVTDFIKSAFKITDLNKDGFGEIWLMYRIKCRGDVSPCDMKLIMRQKGMISTMYGTSKVKLSKNKSIGGDCELDYAFKKGPNAFRTFAHRLWNNHLWEKSNLE